MKFGLDVMGGDFAPQCNIDGAIAALEFVDAGDCIVLLGPEELIRRELETRGITDEKRFEIQHCPDCIEMDEKPLKALAEKPQSGIAVGLKMLSEGKLDSFASAGNSGALLAGAVTIVKCLPGVIRPCTLAWVPQENGKYSLLLDIGTVPDAKPEVLVQFGIIGSIYARHIFGCDNPRVSLMNVGTEDGKGNLQCQTVFPMLKECRDIHFIGNLEPRDLFKDKADVFIADGFVGNILIKSIETFYRMMKKKGVEDTWVDRCNYEEHGGSPILGVNAPVILGHGISSALAVKNILLRSKQMCRTDLVGMMKEAFGTKN